MDTLYTLYSVIFSGRNCKSIPQPKKNILASQNIDAYLHLLFMFCCKIPSFKIAGLVGLLIEFDNLIDDIKSSTRASNLKSRFLTLYLSSRCAHLIQNRVACKCQSNNSTFDCCDVDHDKARAVTSSLGA